MSELGDQLYREVILDHFKNPRGHGVIDDPDASADGQNPLCGDEVSIYVSFEPDGDTIEEVKFSGRGCAISQAATSMLMEMVKGRSASEVLAETLPKEIQSLYWAKNMYWRSGKPERFVRPVRWLLAMLDGEVIPLEFGGIKAGRLSFGHRILSPGAKQIATAEQYQDILAKANVVADPKEREHRIRKALDAATRLGTQRENVIEWLRSIGARSAEPAD